MTRRQEISRLIARAVGRRERLKAEKEKEKKEKREERRVENPGGLSSVSVLATGDLAAKRSAF
jgi:hypothetical protein